MRFAIASGLLLVTLLGPSASVLDDRLLRFHYTPRDQQLNRYVYVPFTVPAGATRLTASYAYDRAGGANVIDLGIYEPGPLTFGTPALRGWSGGARDSVTIGVSDASPGYWPGPLPPGEWHVMLGLYKVAAQGVDVEIAVQVTDLMSRPAPAARPRATAPLRTGPGWYVGVLHAHTTNSDGALSPDALLDKARDEQLDFIAITDHNNTVHQRSSLDRNDLLVITGEEVTTPAGHFNVWGLGGERDYLDFRILPGDPTLGTLMRDATRRGAVIGINHPFADCLACSWTHVIPQAVTALEIANGTPGERLQATAMWDTLLRSGHRVTGVGESDWHRGPAPLGAPALRVWATDLSQASILEALRHGRAVVVARAALPAPEFSLDNGVRQGRPGDTVEAGRGDRITMTVRAPVESYVDARVDLIWNGELVESAPLTGNGTVRFERFASTNGYARVHLVRHDEVLAVTNPIFVTVR